MAKGGRTFCDLAERTALLAEVDDDADAAPLGTLCRLLDAVDQVGPARADVGATWDETTKTGVRQPPVARESKREGMMMNGQDVGAVALVVDAERELLALVAHESRVAKDVDRKTGGRRTGVRRVDCEISRRTRVKEEKVGDAPSDRREEDLKVAPGEELGVHAAGLCKRTGQDQLGQLSRRRCNWCYGGKGATDPRRASAGAGPR